MISSTIIDAVKRSSSIAVIGNGGNLAIAKHAASDMSRHLNKFCFAPECIHMSALGGDERWHEKWIDQYASGAADLLIGITTRIDSPIAKALIGKEKGSSVEVKTPSGSKNYEIISIEVIKL